ncbi:hypothetical protein [Nocardia grenadensis]|uniref:hypothetical protein n=1 Tax=Nocardia grenadensis TaxID=931537 RepID=UPI0007A4085D|nr:hypothetical protein [Nocardia grenadensis]
MSSRIGHPLAYPLCVTIGALAVLTAWAPFADPDQLSGLAVVGVGVVGYSGYRFAVALGVVGYRAEGATTVAVRRVRQEYQLVSRSWLELRGGGDERWLPVYFTPELIGFTGGTALLSGRQIVLRPEFGSTGPPGGPRREFRVLPAGRARETEPPGRLVDNPTRVDPESQTRAATTAKTTRRLLLDAQSAVAAPFVALLWLYVMGGGTGAFIAALCVAAATGTWLGAIRGSDPS